MFGILFSKDIFDAVTIFVLFVSEYQAIAVAGVFDWYGAIDERDAVVDNTFLAEFSEECMGESACFSRYKYCMK